MCKQDGGRHFTEQRRVAEITIDFVIQARGKMSENKVNGPGDSIVSEMIKQLPQEQIYEITRCFQNRFFGLPGAPNFVEDCAACVPEKTRCSTKGMTRNTAEGQSATFRVQGLGFFSFFFSFSLTSTAARFLVTFL